jgi:hypothetical protein
LTSIARRVTAYTSTVPEEEHVLHEHALVHTVAAGIAAWVYDEKKERNDDGIQGKVKASVIKLALTG